MLEIHVMLSMPTMKYDPTPVITNTIIQLHNITTLFCPLVVALTGFHCDSKK